MVCDSLSKNTLAPLVLRVTLGVIFLYHGLQKVASRDEDAGIAWAYRFWGLKHKPPREVLGKIDRMTGISQERIDEVKAKLTMVYNIEAEEVPAALRNYAVQMAVAWTEVLAGAALVLGLLTRVAAAAMIAVQAGAIATVTLAKGFSLPEGGGFEFNVALVAMCLAVVLTGAGTLSVDAWICGKRAKPSQTPAAV